VVLIRIFSLYFGGGIGKNNSFSFVYNYFHFFFERIFQVSISFNLIF